MIKLLFRIIHQPSGPLQSVIRSTVALSFQTFGDPPCSKLSTTVNENVNAYLYVSAVRLTDSHLAQSPLGSGSPATLMRTNALENG